MHALNYIDSWNAVDRLPITVSKKRTRESGKADNECGSPIGSVEHPRHVRQDVGGDKARYKRTGLTPDSHF